MSKLHMNLNDKQRKNMLYAFLINYGIYLVMQLLFYPTYESQLDLMMRAAVEGVSGTKTGYILYSNAIIGWFLCGLSTYFPSVNWYFMMLSALAIAALTVISYIVMKRTSNKIGVTVAVVLASFLGYECYVLPGYMKTASVLTIAAVMIAADEVQQKFIGTAQKKALIAVLALLGSMVSFSVFWITVFISVSGLMISCITLNKKTVKALLYRKDFAYLCVLIALPVLLLRGADCLSYYNSGQTDALKYRSAMERMYGYGMGDYEQDYETEYGISLAEYDAVKKGSFSVSGEADWETLKALSKERQTISEKSFGLFFKTVPLALFGYGIFYLFIAILFVFAFAPVKQKRKFVWGEVILLFGVLLIAYIFNAWKNNWMMFVIVAPVIVPVLVHMQGAVERECRYLWAYLIVFSIILYSKFSDGMVSFVSSELMKDRFGNLSENEIHVVDLNAYLKSFSAKRVCVAGILSGENVVTSNGAYGLIDGFEDCILNGQSDGSRTYSWLYNSQEIDMDVLLEDK